MPFMSFMVNLPSYSRAVRGGRAAPLRLQRRPRRERAAARSAADVQPAAGGRTRTPAAPAAASSPRTCSRAQRGGRAARRRRADAQPRCACKFLYVTP